MHVFIVYKLKWIWLNYCLRNFVGSYVLYRYKIIVDEFRTKHGLNLVRVWKNVRVIWLALIIILGDRTEVRMIGTMYYTTFENRLRIEYLYVNDSDNGCLYSDPKYVYAEIYTRLMLITKFKTSIWMILNWHSRNFSQLQFSSKEHFGDRSKELPS